ncbi:N-ethylammeline chlorohydrolase [Cohnella xylanilytica]|uniref:amidohydrolase family protein n=2 Tax=Cohnella TaxID=329857 RepID=UPI001B2B574A|nr:amidohydrolase [Cohnella xylanilytica]GIO15897.1 N-ethylammeline chlorohydrolase [Cohnella xylanilytica]
MKKDYLITGGTVLTVNSANDIWHDGAVLVSGGRIADIGPSAELSVKYAGADVIDAAGKAVLPGLVNLHLHSGLIRGTAEDMPVFEWLAKHVDPKHRALKEPEAHAASMLCYAESLLAGTTTVLDMYRYMHRSADAAETLGMRAVLSPYVADNPPYLYFESMDKNVRLIEERHETADGRVHVWIGLEHLAYCTEDAYKQAAKLAEKYGVGIHTHGEESKRMARDLHDKFGVWPVELFHRRGILGPRTVLAHCVWMEEAELDLLQKTGTSVAHCPVSNLKLASGISPVAAMLERGINVGIGTDGVKENNNLDMLEEMKFVPLLQKVSRLDARVMKAGEVLRMATMGGAKALGLDREIGSLEIGKKADIIVVDFKKPHLAPFLTGKYDNIVSNLVYSASGQDVDTVMVDGKLLVEGKRLLTGNVEAIMADAQQAVEELLARREAFVPKEFVFPSSRL